MKDTERSLGVTITLITYEITVIQICEIVRFQTGTHCRGPCLTGLRRAEARCDARAADARPAIATIAATDGPLAHIPQDHFSPLKFCGSAVLRRRSVSRISGA
ncbi:hypothetical protein [Pararhizobium sp.]|uniref:hypothetical protein n=1 Tax=Pararhizobium sp. TaxID=1977563 RepID=UPI003BAB3046